MEENEVNINNSNKLQMLNTTSSINSKFGKLLIQDDDNNKKDVEENEVNVNNSNELQMLNTTISINDDFYYSEGENDSLYSNESNGGSAEVERNEESGGEEEEYDDNNNDNEFLGKKRKL